MKITQFLDMNSAVDYKSQARLRELYNCENLTPERPETPNVKVELVLRLTDKPLLYFYARRLSFKEKMKLEKFIEGLIMRKIFRVFHLLARRQLY